MILVAGGTGYLGKVVVERLVGVGERVRVLSRREAASRDGVEIATGDVRDPDAVARAMVGVRVVVSAVHGFVEDPRGIDHDGNANLVAAARAAGVEHFVLLSVHGASADHPIEMFRMKHLAEQNLVASSLAWTIIRPTAFMEMWLTMVGAPLLKNGSTTIFGRGKNPINFVSVHDVARHVELAVTDPTLRGRIIEAGGPENISFCDFVATFEKVTGTSGKHRHVPLPMMRVMSWIMRGLKPSLGRQIRAGVVMDTEDLTFDIATPTRVPMTALADAIRRDYAAHA